LAGDADVEVELDRGAAIRRAVDAANAGDAVAIEGKGHEQGQEARGRVLPFDDRTVARDALARAAAAS
jgi:UDP-N-acetylmuramoyl-L-alanyl-D-glutamate--2,6-diaminopimelate ligase